MKRILALVLAAALALPLVACGGGGSLVQDETETETLIRTTAPVTAETAGVHDATGFCAGFGREDITPQDPVPLAGYGNTSHRISTNALDELYVTCFLLQDENGERLAILQYDMIAIWSGLQETMRKQVAKAAGVAEDHVLLNATHTHSGHDGNNTADEAINRWQTLLFKATADAARKAAADLDRCTVFVGTTETDRLNFVRRYYLENGFVCDNAEYGDGAIVGHETEVDQEMRIVKFDRVNQPDLIIANWQCHPHRTGGSSKTDISSDIIGVMRRRTEENLDAKLLYLQGGGGNINPTSRISSEVRWGGYKEIGQALYEHLAEGLNDLTETKTGSIRAQYGELEGVVNHEKDAIAGDCQTITQLVSSGKMSDAAALIAKHNLSSKFEASAIVSRSKLGETYTIPIYCYAFGDVGIAAAPFEMFCQTEKQLREDSPFSFTLTCGYSNGAQGYMPAAECFPNKGYEVDTCRYVQGTAERINEVQLGMLSELKAK